MKQINKIYSIFILIGIIINYVQCDEKLKTISNPYWTITLDTSSSLKINMEQEMEVTFKMELYNNTLKNSKIQFYCEKTFICDCINHDINILNDKIWHGNIKIKGMFLGKSKLCAKLILPNDEIQISNNCEYVTVLKEYGIADQMFTISIAIVVTIAFICFGAVVDMTTLKQILLKPIGPIIGFCCQFILMPVLSYLLGYLLFLDDINMWLGLFFSGVSPGGGASNMWTLILKGNVNLSIVMTTISNLAAFAMMPLWIFTLGTTIFARGNLGVPYERIAIFSVSLIVPLIIGMALQRFLPKFAKILVRLLKPITIIILIYIMTFAIIINFYVFKLFTGKIILAAMGLPWVGYFLSYLIALLLKQNKEDCLTISIETGLQNTGVAIFLLRFSLEQPDADLTSVIPVAVGFMTLIPLLALYITQKIYYSFNKSEKIEDIPPNPNEEERIMSTQSNQISS